MTFIRALALAGLIKMYISQQGDQRWWVTCIDILVFAIGWALGAPDQPERGARK